MNYLKYRLLHTARQLKYKRISSGVPPLTLQNAVAGKLIDYKIYGNSIQDGVPSGDNPIAIESVGDKTANIFNFNSARVGVANGELIEKTSDHIILKGNDGVAPGATYYSSGQLRLYSTALITEGTTITLSANIKYLEKHPNHNDAVVFSIEGIGLSTLHVANIRKSDVSFSLSYTMTAQQTSSDWNITLSLNSSTVEFSNILVNIGETALPYEPYGYKIPVIVKGKNLFDKNTVQEGFIDNADGGSKSSNLYFASDYIEIPSQAATLTITNTGNAMWGAFYDASKQFVAGLAGYKQPKIIPENAKYLRITIAKAFLDTMQVEEGSVATTFEPYVEPVTTNIYLDEPLRKIGDYADYIDYENQKAMRNISNVILDGSEGWILQWNDGTAVWSLSGKIRESKYFSAATTNILCANEYYRAVAFDKGSQCIWRLRNVDEAPYLIAIGDTPTARNIIFLKHLGITTVADMKAWLAEHNTVLYYVLNEPIEETIDLPDIAVSDGTNIIDVDTTVTPSNVEVEYFSKEKE